MNTSAEAGVDYTSTPTHLRIYTEDCGDEWSWHLDGADEYYCYTEDVRRFATFAEALAYAPTFIEDNAHLDWQLGKRRTKQS